MLTGNFTSTGQSQAYEVRGDKSAHFNISLSDVASGTGSTITLQRSFDRGVVWRDIPGNTYTADVEMFVNDPGVHVDYRWDCTTYGGSPVNYGIGK